MKNLWSDAEARKVTDAYIAKGINPDLAVRVYTTRLLGSEPKLVLHGGGFGLDVRYQHGKVWAPHQPHMWSISHLLWCFLDPDKFQGLEDG